MILPTHILSTILLNNRNGMNMQQLKDQIQLLLLILKKWKISLSRFDLRINSIIRIGALHLKECVKITKDPYQPLVEPSKQYKDILLLAYYKNSIMHVFINEAFIAVSLLGFGPIIYEEGVDMQQLWVKTNQIR